MNEKEATVLNQNVQHSGLSREAYLRHLISGAVPKGKPPLDYYAMMRQLYQIGNNLNQIARSAHALKVIDAQRYDAAVQRLDIAIREITDAVLLPTPMEHGSWQ